MICCFSMGLWVRTCTWLELFTYVHAERAPLKAILRVVFVETMEVQRNHPRQVRQPELAADGVDLVECAARAGSCVAGDLPGVVACRADFQQQALRAVQRKKFADTPVEREIVAVLDLEGFLL